MWWQIIEQCHLNTSDDRLENNDIWTCDDRSENINIWTHVMTNLKNIMTAEHILVECEIWTHVMTDQMRTKWHRNKWTPCNDWSRMQHLNTWMSSDHMTQGHVRTHYIPSLSPQSLLWSVASSHPSYHPPLPSPNNQHQMC